MTGKKGNRIIFLDVDGVLNSLQYFYQQEVDGHIEYGLVDPAAAERLSRLVKDTDARLVLSSSWRDGWDPNPDKIQPALQYLSQVLGRFGLEISDKTPSFRRGKREEEILCWLSRTREKIDSFVILDDAEYCWKRFHLHHRWVQTDFQEEGLTEEHLEKARSILLRRIGCGERILLFFHSFFLPE